MQTDWHSVNSLPPCPDVAPGLACLQQVDQVLIHQKHLHPFQTSRKYEILSSRGQKLLFAKDERALFGPWMNIKIVDNTGREVLHLCLYSRFFNNEVEVFSPSGKLLGSIVKETHVFKTRLSVLNHNKVAVLRVHGPTIGRNAFGDVTFKVKTPGGSQVVGGITRVWRGMRKEMFSNNDHYSMYFPMQLDVKVKALLISTGLFVDYLIYERK